jgi:hypothetical protein
MPDAVADPDYSLLAGNSVHGMPRGTPMGPKLRPRETPARNQAMRGSFGEGRDAGARRNAAKSGRFASISGTGQERLVFLAERVRFELTVPVKVQRFSRPSRSTTPAPLRGQRGGIASKVLSASDGGRVEQKLAPGPRKPCKTIANFYARKAGRTGCRVAAAWLAGCGERPRRPKTPRPAGQYFTAASMPKVRGSLKLA